MRFRIEVLLALGFGGLALTGLIIPILGYLFLGLAALVAVDIGRDKLGISLRSPFARRGATKNQAKPSISDSREHSLIQWTSSLVDGDTNDLGSRVVAAPRSFTLNLGEDPAYIDFAIDTVNASVFLIDVGKEIDGHIKMDRRTLVTKPELAPLSGNTGSLMHGQHRDIALRQFLTSDDKTALSGWDKSDTLPFDFTGLNMWVVSRPPSDSGVSSAKVRLTIRPPFLHVPKSLVR